MVKRVLILGAAGRDFHVFNVLFRNNPEYRVVAFTAAQLPGIERRRYPPELAGELYPDGIPILPESKLEEIIKEYRVDEAILAYSDLTYDDVMDLASRVLSAGASFKLLSPDETMLTSIRPVIAVTASRTGAGKSTTSKKIVRTLKSWGIKVVPVRHPMPYEELSREYAVQRFEKFEDLDKYGVSIEEREEYEPYIEMGVPIYAGIDYGEILRCAEKEADIILWDGGNNDTPFYRPDLWICVVDPTRPGNEKRSYPGSINVRRAHVIVINKVNIARPEDVEAVEKNVKELNPKATIIKAESRIVVDKPELIKGKRVVVVEDAPTVTHGGAPYAAGYVAAKEYGAAEIVDPRPYAVGIIKEAYEKYKHMKEVVPSLGYTPEQRRDLEETLNRVPADVIVLGTMSNIARYLKLNKPVVRISFELHEVEGPKLEDILADFVEKNLGKKVK